MNRPTYFRYTGRLSGRIYAVFNSVSPFTEDQKAYLRNQFEPEVAAALVWEEKTIRTWM